jgi:hypothetical protein
MPLPNQAGGKWDLASVHPLNAFLWNELESEFGMSESDYAVTEMPQGLVPIIPSQQIPLLTRQEKPFLVYNWTTEDQGVDWYLQHDQIMYLVYSEEEKEIRQLVNFMRSLFEKFDESAAPVNHFVRNSTSDNWKRFNYKYIQVLSGSGGALPLGSEGGRQESMVSIRVTYTVER